MAKTLQENIKALATIVSHENDPLNSTLQKKIELEVSQNAEQLQNAMYEGLKACIDGLSQCQEPKVPVEKLIRELHQSFKAIASQKQLADLGEQLFLEVSWKQALDLSDDCMQALYQGARILFENKLYAQAEKAFFVICSIDPSQYAYWIGLGHSSFQEKNFQQAINAYSMASAFHPENVRPHIWAANCFEEERDFEHAKLALNTALSLQKSNAPKNHELLQSLEKRVQNLHSR